MERVDHLTTVVLTTSVHSDHLDVTVSDSDQ